MHNFDPTNNISWQLGHRGRVAVFIDGNNLFHAARFHNIDIDYNKLLRVLLGDGRLLRAFFYTGVDIGAERQQGFLLWMRRNGFRVIQKELKTFYDGTRKANLDVEIAVDMLVARRSLRYGGARLGRRRFRLCSQRSCLQRMSRGDCRFQIKHGAKADRRF